MIYQYIFYYFIKIDENLLLDIIQLILICIGGLWALYHFYIQRNRFPKIEFSLELNIIDHIDNKYLLELVGVLKNSGMVRKYVNVKSFKISIRYLTNEDISKGLNNDTKIMSNKTKEKPFFMLNMPNRLGTDNEAQEIKWIPDHWDYLHVDSGTTQKVTLPFVIKDNIKFILVKSSFYYKDKKSGRHSAQKIFKLT